MVNPRRAVLGVRGGPEDVHVGHAAGGRVRVGRAVGIGVPGDQCVGRPRGKRARPLRGYINVKRRIILRHALPDALDGQLLGVTEGRKVGVRAERHGGNLRATHDVIPLRVADDFPGEVHVKDIRRARTAVKNQAGRERTDRHRRLPDRGRVVFGCGGINGQFTGIKNSSVGVGVQRGQILLGEVKAAQPLAGAFLRRVRQLFKLCPQPAGRQLVQAVQAANGEFTWTVRVWLGDRRSRAQEHQDTGNAPRSETLNSRIQTHGLRLDVYDLTCQQKHENKLHPSTMWANSARPEHHTTHCLRSPSPSQAESNLNTQ